MSSELITLHVNMLPDFILESQQFYSWRGLFPDETIFHIPDYLLLSNLDIKSQKNIDTILECEAHFIFTQKHRLTILRNIYKFWREDHNSSEMRLPNEKMSQFGDQVRALFDRPNTTFMLMMKCMKNNYLDLYEYLLERDGDSSFISSSPFAVFPLLHYAVINNNTEILVRGIETGCPLKFELLEDAIIKNNINTFIILIREIKKQNIQIRSSTFIKAVKTAPRNMLIMLLNEFVTGDIDDFCFVRCRGELINEALSNPENLRELLIERKLGLHRNHLEYKKLGEDLIEKCLQKSRPLETICILENCFRIKLEDYRQSRPKNEIWHQYINDEIIKQDNLELYTYMRQCGYLIGDFSEDVAVNNATIKISPGLVKQHYNEDRSGIVYKIRQIPRYLDISI